MLAWINAYDPNRDLARAPSVMKKASDLGAMNDAEGAGMFVGFMAGMIGSNPEKADAIIEKLLVMRAADHWAVVRAIAYSGHPDWRGLMTRFAPKMPTRELMAQRYLEGKLPTPDTPVAEDKTSWRDRANPTKWFARKDSPRTSSWRDRVNPAKWRTREKDPARRSVRRCSTCTGAIISPRAAPRRSSA